MRPCHKLKVWFSSKNRESTLYKLGHELGLKEELGNVMDRSLLEQFSLLPQVLCVDCRHMITLLSLTCLCFWLEKLLMEWHVHTCTQKSKWCLIVEMLCTLWSLESSIFWLTIQLSTASCKLVHEFANNHYECDLGNVIWKKPRLGFGNILTKIRMASRIWFPCYPTPGRPFMTPF